MSIVQILIDVVRAETATSVPFSMRPRLSFSRIEVALKNISFYSMFGKIIFVSFIRLDVSEVFL